MRTAFSSMKIIAGLRESSPPEPSLSFTPTFSIQSVPEGGSHLLADRPAGSGGRGTCWADRRVTEEGGGGE